MKYLKYFESNSFDVLKEDIKDICLELTDIGYSIKIRKKIDDHDIFTNYGEYRFSIGKNNGDHYSTDPELYFDYKDVKETIERLKEYLGKNRVVNVQVLNNEEDEDGNLSLVRNRLNTKVDGIMMNSWYLHDIYSLEIEFKL